MNRDIKFRAFNGKEMVDLKKITPLVVDNVVGDGIFIPFSDKLPIMQFTGLTDKNGVEIYEGDVLSQLRHEDENNWASKRIHKPEYAKVISFKDGSFVDECGRPINDFLVNIVSRKVEFEIIGNIYENPELLKIENDNP